MLLYDGKDSKVQFRISKIERELPASKNYSKKKLKKNFEKIHRQLIEMFEGSEDKEAAFLDSFLFTNRKLIRFHKFGFDRIFRL